MREEFYLHETHMARYLVYSFGKCAMKLCIETDLIVTGLELLRASPNKP